MEPIDRELSELSMQLSSMEALNSTLCIVGNQVKIDGISLEDAQYLSGLAPDILPGTCPINSFTRIPSGTNLKVALEAIDYKRAGVIAAIVAALTTFLYKVYQWLTTGSTSGTGDESPAAKTAERIEAAEEKVLDRIETIQSSDHASDFQKKLYEQAKAIASHDANSPSSELTDELVAPHSKLEKLMDSMVTTVIPKLHNFIRTLVDHYNELAKRPAGSPEMREAGVGQPSNLQNLIMVNAIDKNIAHVMTLINTEMDNLNLSSSSISPEKRSSQMTVSTASQILRELQAMASRPAQGNPQLDLQRLKDQITGNRADELTKALDALTPELAAFTDKMEKGELLTKEIRWPDDILNNPDHLKWGETTFELYRKMIEDSANALAKLYQAVNFMGTRYVAYLNYLNHLLMMTDKEYRDSKSV